MTLTEFLLARIAEDEAVAERAGSHNGRGTFAKDNYGCLLVQPARVLAECEVKRRIVELHQSWPVLVERTPPAESLTSDLAHMTFSMSRQIMWLTEQEYRARFGDEPPTAPMLAAMATVYADHPDYDETWRL